MKKNGFTLIEIIVSITLIVIIGTVTFVGFKLNNNDEKHREKVISDVVSAAEVYYSANPELKKELDDNYGYKVLTIDELKKQGILDEKQEIPQLTTEEETEGKTYDKMVIDGTAYNDIGYNDFIYPYVKGDVFIANLDPLYIEYEEKNSFKCNSKLEKIDYLNEDYEKISTSNFKCGILSGEESAENISYKDSYDSKLNLTSNEKETTENTIFYKIVTDDGNTIYGDRIVSVNSKYNPTLKAYYTDSESDNDSVSKAEYTCNTYTNKDITLSLEQDNDNDHPVRNISYIWSKGDIEISTDVKTTSSYTVNVNDLSTGKYDYSVKYQLKGALEDKIIAENTYNCQIYVDKTEPKITPSVTGSTLKVEIKDDDSGVAGYIISTTKIDDLDNATFDKYNSTISKNVTVGNTYYIYAKDNAGNIAKIEDYEIIGEAAYPSITYEAIPNSFSKFKVTIKNVSNNSKYNFASGGIKVQYEFNEDKYKFKNRTYTSRSGRQEYADLFQKDYTYNSSYDKNKRNYINVNCSSNSSECSFILDMEDVLNDGYDPEYRSKNEILTQVVKYQDLYNLDLNYYVYAKNKEGYYKEMKINAILNVFEDEEAFNDKWFRYHNWTPALIATNMNGDILFTQTHSIDKERILYYYNTKDGYLYSLLDYDFSAYKNIAYEFFDNNEIKYTICETYKDRKTNYKHYITYRYNIATKYNEKIEERNYKTSTKCNFISSVNDQYAGSEYFSLENYEFLKNYLKRLGKWEEDTITNPTTHSLSSIANNKIFYTKKNNKMWSNVITEDSYRNGGDQYQTLMYNKLYFSPEVSLSSTVINKN